MIAFALVCRAILLHAMRKDRLDQVAWQPSNALPLDWLDALASDPEAGRIKKSVDRWVTASFSESGSNIHDWIRPVYERLIPATVRRQLGEHYTPAWLADHLVEQLWDPGLRWIDPTVGGGAFLLALYRQAQRTGGSFDFAGCDRNPWAVLAAAANAAMAQRTVSSQTEWKIPIACLDVVADSQAAVQWGSFQRVVGNPPWIVWDRLPDPYRAGLQEMWKHYGFFTETGMASILGSGKKDLAMLITYLAADRFLQSGGQLGFVITRSILSAAGSARGFRRFQLPDGSPMCVDRIDDLSGLKPFHRVNANAVVIFLTKGESHHYPVPYYRWESADPRDRVAEFARPSESADPLSSWSHATASDERLLRCVLAPSNYHAHLGVNTGGANGIYWFQRRKILDGDRWEVENLAQRSRLAIDKIRTVLETRFLYPVLLGKDLQSWHWQPSAWVLLVQDTQRRRGIDEATLQRQAPLTYAYLQRFEDQLRSRAAFQRYFTVGQPGHRRDKAPFYTMFDVGSYTLAPWKVAWNRMGSTLGAAVVSTFEDKVVLPQETHGMIAAASEQEAHYLAAILNSQTVQRALEMTGQVGGKSFATPRAVHRLGLRTFDPDNPLHCRLSELSQLAHEQAKRTKIPEQVTLLAIEESVKEYWGLSPS